MNNKKEDAVEKLQSKLKVFIPISGALFFSLQILFLLLFEKNKSTLFFKGIFLLDLISILASIYLIFHPEKYLIYGIICFTFTIFYTFAPVNEITIVLCYMTSLIIFGDQGLLKKRKILVFIFCLSSIIIIIVIRIIILKKEYIVRLIETWPYIFALILMYFFISKITATYKKNQKYPIINLNNYYELTERQKKLIESILQNEKYDTFARDNNISVSVVKKEATEIFKVFDVFDKNTFQLKYLEYTFLWNGRKLPKKS